MNDLPFADNPYTDDVDALQDNPLIRRPESAKEKPVNEFERRVQLGWHVSIRVDNIAYDIPDLVIYAGGDEPMTRAFFLSYYPMANQRTDVTKVMLNNGLVEVDYVYMTVPHVPAKQEARPVDVALLETEF